jgi:hypothetical protein
MAHSYRRRRSRLRTVGEQPNVSKFGGDTAVAGGDLPAMGQRLGSLYREKPSAGLRSQNGGLHAVTQQMNPLQQQNLRVGGSQVSTSSVQACNIAMNNLS